MLTTFYTLERNHCRSTSPGLKLGAKNLLPVSQQRTGRVWMDGKKGKKSKLMPQFASPRPIDMNEILVPCQDMERVAFILLYFIDEAI